MLLCKSVTLISLTETETGNIIILLTVNIISHCKITNFLRLKPSINYISRCAQSSMPVCIIIHALLTTYIIIIYSLVQFLMHLR